MAGILRNDRQWVTNEVAKGKWSKWKATVLTQKGKERVAD
jgi:hypothetical protein